ncbi:MAG: hypothetical protein HC802_19745 [Caldilineaceae bacterium]|nr:hypothetical protein [Caldilineaceae bacterium]
MLEGKPLRTTQSLALDDLVRLGDFYIRRVTEKNSKLFIRLIAQPPLNYFQPVNFHLWDLEKAVSFDLTDGLRELEDDAETHVSLSSESLAFVLKHDWGIDTLDVSGRFRTSQTHYNRLIKAFFLGALNNTGRYLHPRTLFEPSFMKRALLKLRKLR